MLLLISSVNLITIIYHTKWITKMFLNFDIFLSEVAVAGGDIFIFIPFVKLPKKNRYIPLENLKVSVIPSVFLIISPVHKHAFLFHLDESFVYHGKDNVL